VEEGLTKAACTHYSVFPGTRRHEHRRARTRAAFFFWRATSSECCLVRRRGGRGVRVNLGCRREGGNVNAAPQSGEVVPHFAVLCCRPCWHAHLLPAPVIPRGPLGSCASCVWPAAHARCRRQVCRVSRDRRVIPCHGCWCFRSKTVTGSGLLDHAGLSKPPHHGLCGVVCPPRTALHRPKATWFHSTPPAPPD